MNYSQLSDSVLIQSYISGNEEAFGVLLDRHKEAIFKFIFHKVKETELSNDLFKKLLLK